MHQVLTIYGLELMTKSLHFAQARSIELCHGPATAYHDVQTTKYMPSLWMY